MPIPHNFIMNHSQLIKIWVIKIRTEGHKFNFNLYEENRKYSHMSLNITWYKELSIDKHENNEQNTWWAHVGTGQNW